MRVAVILHSINLAYKCLQKSNVVYKQQITNEYENECNRLIGMLVDSDYIIQYGSFKLAIEIVDYFYKQLLILSGYVIKPHLTFEQILNSFKEGNIIFLNSLISNFSIIFNFIDGIKREKLNYVVPDHVESDDEQEEGL
jgi:hypothetical protein